MSFVKQTYLILDQRKAIYDQFGEEGLKNGVPVDKINWSEPYTYCNDANKIFYEFFGGDNPFAGILGVLKTIFSFSNVF